MAFQRTEQQEAVVQNRGGGLLVSAAAGSGKTRVLVERLLERVTQENHRIDEFLIITFTRAAAEELRARISRELSKKLNETPTDLHLRRQMALLYQTQISTIHALCTVLLREWGHLLDIPADFSLCEEEDADVLKMRTLNEVLDKRYEDIQPDSAFAQLLDILSGGRDDSRLMEIVLDVYGRMQSHPDPTQWMAEQNAVFQLDGVQDVSETQWGQILLEDAKRVISYWIEQMERAAVLSERDPVLASAYLDSLTETLDGLQDFRAALEKGWDAVRAVSVLFPRLKAARNVEDVVAQTRIKAIREKCKDAMAGLTARFESNSASLLEDLRLVAPAMQGLFSLVEEFSAAYNRAKLKKGILDFSDLEHFAVQLLTDAEGQPTELAKQWGSQFVEIMVDEYQDTNQVQNTIFDALSDAGRNLFMVGDVKQSIYRFRLADPTIFLSKYRNFAPYEEAKAGEPRKISLSQNFRSRPEVLETANDLFRAIMSEQLGEMNYTDAEALYPGGTFPAGTGYETELHVLDVQDAPEVTEEKVSKSRLEARFVAERIRGMLEEPFPVSDENGGMRAVRPEDIVILLRSPGTVRHHYISALQAWNIPWAAEGGGDFFAATEVSVALAFLQIIDNPHQDIPLLAVLRSPLYAFSPDRLATIRAKGTGDFYEALCAEEGEDCASFLNELEALRFGAGEQSSHQLLWNLYQRTGFLELFGAMPEGAARQSNLLVLYELARRFEGAGHRGLFGFLSHLARVQEQGKNPSVSAGAQEQAGVQILSIHRSKGLEYPVVFLCGLGKRFNNADLQKPVLFHPRFGLGPKGLDVETMVEFHTLAREAVGMQLKREMLAEEMRLLYVAMTRAKEKLVLVYTLAFGESDLIKLAGDVADPVEPQALAACASVGQWIALVAMAKPEGAVLRKIAGVEEAAQESAFASVWKIFHHSGSVALPASVRHAKRAEMQNPTPTVEDCITRLSWRYPNAVLATLPAKVTATQLKRPDPEETPATALFPAQTQELYRPRFAAEEFGLTAAQKGTALHTILQNIHLSRTNSVAEIQEEIARLAVQAYLTGQEAESADPKQIQEFFSTPLGQELIQASELYREYPFSVLVSAQRYFPEAPVEETVLLQGIVDAWFETEDGITIVDFKTDRVFGKNLEARARGYREQLETYGLALEEVTGKPVGRKILWFFYPNVGFEI